MSFGLTKQLRAGCAAISIVCLASSHIRPLSAQQPSSADLDRFMQSATKAAEARDKELAEMRAMMSELVNRNRALESQIEATLQMQAQALAIQMKSLSGDVKDRTVKEVRDVAAQGRQAMDTTIEKLKKGTSPEEKRLGAALEGLKSIIPNDADVATMGKEKFDELQKDIETAKREMDSQLRSYGKDLAEQLRSKCRGANADSAALVAAARGGASDTELQARAAQMGCEVGSDLLDRLANARNAEQAQAAFQSAMTSMMMLAISSGNPYVIAAVAIIMMVTALFSGGGSGGGGGGSAGADKGSGRDGRIGSGTGDNTGPSPSPGTKPGSSPSPTPAVQPGSTPGGSPSGVQLQSSATGCSVVADGTGDILTVAPADQRYTPYSIKLSAIKEPKPANFPKSWRDSQVTLSRCDGASQALYIWLRPGPQANPLCFMFYKKENSYLVTDKEYGVDSKAATCTPL